MSDLIRTGLIGYGYAGRTFHAPLICSVSGLALTIIGTSKPETDIPGAAICPPAAVPTYPDLDLIVIATPNESHYPLAAAALRAGKDVVLDKPFTLDLAEARSLAQIAKDHGRLLSVFHNRRWDSEVLATNAVIDSGVLGQVTHYECHMDRFRPAVRQRWREDPGPGAGLWFDLGPHLIDQAVFLFGLPHSVSASFATLRPGGQTDDWAHVQLFYEDLRVVLHTTLLAAATGPRSTLHGTAGTWMKYGMDVQEDQLKAGMSPNDQAFGIDPDPGILTDGATGRRTEIPAPRGDQRQYYIGVRDAILGCGPLPVATRDAVAVMAILEATFESGAQGKVVPIALTLEERGAFELGREVFFESPKSSK